MGYRISRRSMFTGSLGAVITTGLAAMPAACRGHVYPGARVHGLDLAGRTADDGERILRAELEAFEQRPVTFTFEDQSWDFSLAELGVTINYGAMISQAMEHGRDGSILDRYVTLIPENRERYVALELHYDETTMRAVLEGIDSQIAKEPRRAVLEVQDGEIGIVDGVTGRKLDMEDALIATVAMIDTGKPGTVALETEIVEPDVHAADLAEAYDDALRLISAPVVFTHGELNYPVDVPTLAEAVVIDDEGVAQLDTASMATRLDAIENSVFAPAQNVKLGWDGGLYVVADDVHGYRVDRDALNQEVIELARSEDRVAELPVVPIKAEARADNFTELGIDAYLATGSSSFSGSSASRAENVAVSARNISYKLVAPGEMFSFNELLGPITPEAGFVEGMIIDGDFTATDIGGGVCQVSTTVFRAAARAGFQFDEWNPHSWRLAFYEADGSPPGFDGAIYQPNTEWEYEQDLRFRNPLDSWLLLQVLIDGNTVAAHFYGRPNGWHVELGEARLGEPQPIPEPVERVNENRAPGERVMVQQAQAGVTVHLRRTVTAADGTLVSDGDFVSNFVSVPETWEVGPT